MTQYIRNIFVAMLMAGGAGIFPQTIVAERIEHGESPLPQVKVAEGALELSAPEADTTVRFDIYSITGQLVKSVELRSATERIELPQGCYIVRTPGRSQKFVIK